MKAFGFTEYGFYEASYYILFAEDLDEANNMLKEQGRDGGLEEIPIKKGLHMIGYYTE